MANARGKSIDNTHLSIDQAERRGFLHRDYIAHCLRWSHVCKYINLKQRYKTARVLDIGCGIDLPLAKMLYSSRLIVQDYVGVDYNKTDKLDMSPFHTGKMSVSAYGNVDAAKDIHLGQGAVNAYSVGSYQDDESNVHTYPSIITCFEVLEHIEPEHCRRMLQFFHEILGHKDGEATDRNGVAFISTPCWDPHTGAAANHVSEIKYHALGALIEDLGFVIENHYGTFASQKDYKKDLPPEEAKLFNRMSEYYDSNYMATIFAPLYPEKSRNCLWKIRPIKEGEEYERKFDKLIEVNSPWTSSESWSGLNGPMTDEELSQISGAG